MKLSWDKLNLNHQNILDQQIRVNDNCYKVSGRMDIDDLMDLGFPVPDGDYEMNNSWFYFELF